MKRLPNRLLTFLSLTFQACTCLAFVIFLYTEIFIKTNIPKCNPNVNLLGFALNKCYMRFNPNVDLNPLFDVNTKQVFLYATMITGSQHEMCWSKIVQREDPKRFFETVNNNYPFGIVEGKENIAEVFFELRASILPRVGRTKDILLAHFSHKLQNNE
ncbi:hypothetical protein EHP00_541 [Ecytonucleospora hepatopenaei]|uniref:Uncharacterized protein n=1 Tax=Ecytonucleospora hepatopenaei TaxID=646526 RepID=A0A1W0E8H3_9MICR|nr:hypothetical protein EHP00_541 [Ecytonucleospora hepatopenaei]